MTRPMPPVRSIPACAGEPSPHCMRSYESGVYPRVCGGTLIWQEAGDLDKGLSPRVRGNRRVPVPLIAAGGSIPACAGEPI